MNVDTQLCLEYILKRSASIAQDITFGSVLDWKAAHKGSIAIGYFPVYTPVEIIYACGALPVGLNGAGDRLDIQHADARFGSFICSIVKTTMELGLTGHMDPLDGLLFQSICDSARNLCFVYKRNFADHLYVDFLHLPHNPSSVASLDFLVSEYRRLKKNLENLSGRNISDEDIRRAIEVYNENRMALSDLYRFRDQTPHLILTTELHSLLCAGNFLAVEEHTRWIRSVLEALPGRNLKKRDNIRVVVEGSFCEQPPMGLIKTLEEAGCYVVDDDFILGRRWFHEDVPMDGDPIHALAESYLHRSVYSSVRHDWRKPRFVGLVEKVKARKANAVVFCIAKFCEPAYFDYVLFRKELDKEGIPHLLVEFEEKMFTFERTRTEIETFVESLLFE